MMLNRIVGAGLFLLAGTIFGHEGEPGEDFGRIDYVRIDDSKGRIGRQSSWTDPAFQHGCADIR